MDILFTGSNISNLGLADIYRNDGNDIFTEQPGIQQEGVNYSSAAWGDYNNDGYLDILLTGKSQSNFKILKIYRNNRNSTFTDQTTLSVPSVMYSSVAWGDYNKDGWLDILLTGLDNSLTRISKIYHNNGNNTFTELTGVSLPGVSNGSVAWGIMIMMVIWIFF